MPSTFTPRKLGSHPALPHGRRGVFHLGCFFKKEPHFAFRNVVWSGLVQTPLLFRSPPSLLPHSHVDFFLFPSSRPLFLLSSAWNILHPFHVQPTHPSGLSSNGTSSLRPSLTTVRNGHDSALVCSSRRDVSPMRADRMTASCSSLYSQDMNC